MTAVHGLTSAMVILNYNGIDLLKRFMPSWTASVQAAGQNCRLIVLDNQSKDESLVFLRENYPQVTVFSAPENKVLCSFNWLAAQVSEDILIFMNSDIETEPGFIPPLIETFSRRLDDVFLVTTHEDCSRPAFHWGAMHAGLVSGNSPVYTFSAGIGAFHRKRFLELGGYDEMYLPGYYEDVDLCFRAWKKGYKAYYEPRARKKHLGSASFKKVYGSEFIQKVTARNAVLFMIKNIRDPLLLLRWVFLLAARFSTAWILGKRYFYAGLCEACGRLETAFESRKKSAAKSALNDREVVAFFKGGPA